MSGAQLGESRRKRRTCHALEVIIDEGVDDEDFKAMW